MVKIIEVLKPLLAACGVAMLDFVFPLWQFLLLTIVLVLTDLYTGTLAAKHRGETIHSKGLRRSVTKITLYFIAILISRAMQNVFGVPFDLAYIASALVAITEFKSNLENIHTVTGVDFWANFADKIPSFKDIFKKKGDGELPNNPQ